MVSNLRAERSESGMVTANSCSRPLTKSGRAKESRRPEEKRDSSVAGLDVVAGYGMKDFEDAGAFIHGWLLLCEIEQATATAGGFPFGDAQDQVTA